MAYAQSKTISVEKIPVIDVAPLRFGTMEKAQTDAVDIRQAAEAVGILYIRNNGIPEAVIEQS